MVSPTGASPTLFSPVAMYPTSPRRQAPHLLRRRREHAHLQRLALRPGRHHPDAPPGGRGAVEHPHVGNHALVRVVLGIEDQRAQRLLASTARRRNPRHYRLQDVLHAQPVLRGRQNHLVLAEAERLLHLHRHPLRLGDVQVDLVYDRDYLQIVLQRQVHVRQRLRLDALRRVHHQQRALARRQAARHLVREVDVSGRVDQVELVLPTVSRGVAHPHRLRLYGDAPLALQLHAVQQLVHHVARVHRARGLQQPVGERGLAVIHVGDDAEVANRIRFHSQLV